MVVDPNLDFCLYCVFSHTAGVADLSANEAQHLALMDKTHGGRTGGRVYPRHKTQDRQEPTDATTSSSKSDVKKKKNERFKVTSEGVRTAL